MTLKLGKNKKNGGKFRLGYLIYLGVLAVIMAAALIYVHVLLVDFEASQPDNVAAAALAEINRANAEGKLTDKLTLPEIGNPKFEDADASVYLAEYLDSVKGKEFSITPGGSSYSGTEVTYNLMADGKKVGTLYLESSNTVTKLVVFTMSDWAVTKIEPAITLTTYDYYVKVPEGFSLKINGISAGEDELAGAENGTVAYEIKGLVSEADIEICDADGNEAYYDIENNTVTPVTYEYSIELPTGFDVFVNGKKLECAEAEGAVTYKIVRAAKPQIVLLDPFGNSFEYSGAGDIPLAKYDVTIPENYTLSLNNVLITGGITSDNKAYQYIAELGITTLPKQTAYTVYLFDNASESEAGAPAFIIRDPDGNEIPYTFKGNSINVSRQIGYDTMPDELADEVDVLYIAETWSKFMTNDVGGIYNGFYTVAEFLKPDSYLYEVARKWAVGVDITFVSIHVLGDPPFINESVTNYVRYSDNCFSVDVSLVKVMLLNSGKRVDDAMNCTFYFVNEGGSWFVADIIEIVD